MLSLYRKITMNIVNSYVASSLETFILASVAKALGQDSSVIRLSSQLALNKELARQDRRQHQEIAAHMIKEAFHVDGPTGPLTIHWVGKVQPAMTGSEL